jgi:xylulokinase
VVLVGGGARSQALREIAPSVLGRSVVVPPAGEYVADGAARQAAWVLSGAAEPPQWPLAGTQTFEADAVRVVRERYAEVREMTATRATTLTQ